MQANYSKRLSYNQPFKKSSNHSVNPHTQINVLWHLHRACLYEVMGNTSKRYVMICINHFFFDSSNISQTRKNAHAHWTCWIEAYVKHLWIVKKNLLLHLLFLQGKALICFFPELICKKKNIWNHYTKLPLLMWREMQEPRYAIVLILK